MRYVTRQELQEECRRFKCTLTLDVECQCYRATARRGWRFESGLHELVSVFGSGFIGNGKTPGDARNSLIKSLRDYRALEKCELLRCEWCQSA